MDEPWYLAGLLSEHFPFENSEHATCYLRNSELYGSESISLCSGSLSEQLDFKLWLKQAASGNIDRPGIFLQFVSLSFFKGHEKEEAFPNSFSNV